jgi:chromodomain protein Y
VLEYEVEELVSSRELEKDQKEYLVKWKGWPTQDNTWEPESHLRNAQQAISEFDVKFPHLP